MKTTFLVLFFLGLINISLAQKPLYSISKIRAHLFYKLNKYADNPLVGTFSENIVDNANFSLWNTAIGEGSAGSPSTQTLVVVEVKGPNEANDDRTIRVVCKLDGKVITKQETDFSTFTRDNNYSYALILNDTGCGKVEILAEIYNKATKKVESKLMKIIDFGCGE